MPNCTARPTHQQVADLLVWVGISFEQSASVEYFRRVRAILSSLGRLDVPQARRGTLYSTY